MGGSRAQICAIQAAQNGSICMQPRASGGRVIATTPHCQLGKLHSTAAEATWPAGSGIRWLPLLTAEHLC
jgi:hypothetical protein